MFSYVKHSLKGKMKSHKFGLVWFLMLFVFIWALFSKKIDGSIFHGNGLENIGEIFKAALSPDLSTKILKLAVEGTIITFTYAAVGISIGLLIAFILSLLSSGIVLPNNRAGLIICMTSRNTTSILRAIHELVWAWLFVASIGLTPASAVLALAIPYGGMIGKVWTDIFLDVPKKPLEALTSSGASKGELLLYGYLPSALPHMRNYALYRFECAVRASAILSFVGLRGLGYQIQLSLNDLQYNEIWTYIYFLLILVVIISSIGPILNKNKGNSLSWLTCLFLTVSFIISWGYVLIVEKMNLFIIFSKGNIEYFLEFIKNLFGIGSEKLPSFLILDSWRDVLLLTFDTVKMSIIAIGITTIFTLATVVPSSSFFSSSKRITNLIMKALNTIFRHFIQFIYLISRAIPELIWGMIIVFLLKPGILTGALALALHNFGILGKLCSDSLDNINRKPLENLHSTGASKGQLLIYGVIPMMMRKFLSFILYRWEVIMRTTIIIGFIGAGGLGQRFKLSMSWFHYTDITLILICYIFLVILSDSISRKVRNLVS